MASYETGEQEIDIFDRIRTIFSSEERLPFLTPRSMIDRAFSRTSSDGGARLEQGALHTSKHITIW